MGLRLCVVSFKPCWQDDTGAWLSDGGFPLQMAAIASLFDETTLVVVRVDPRDGGIPLPAAATVVGLRSPAGADTARKLSVLSRMNYYVRTISAHVRDADVVHAPVPGDISLIGLLLALAFRKRTIGRYGSSWALTSQTTMAQRVTRWCMRVAAGGRNVMLATGVGTAPPAPRMRWIFSTALTETELQAIRTDLDRPLGAPPRLVYVGRLSTEKGVRYLLRALRRLRDAGETMPVLTLLGDGPERSSLEALVDELSLRDVVSFAGHLNRAQLSSYLSNADLCVQPSLTEGFSKAWLDAMAHGVPVLSSAVGAAPAVIGESGERGWLVPPGDEMALADTLSRVLREGPRWPALRRVCRSFVEQRTLDAWSREIAGICVEHWGGGLRDGKLYV
ncbi:MAG: glycosyltransferase family 4 protein [Acidobacteria bacterium]|nr:glycosyltransferase family 4 protein [Acidobacteriota bacterium]